ncbi:hypothetical protein [Halarcobacter bivalviorum]|uniref:Uncharacterized protein n=1 Tax=Halarcobacter bivalviorum TaxID=663364 RepID=A0AAX2A6G3_9BACT|nr:hypothetical protein [Halarcobacter bivalviorum]AXH13039.1 hypothetical protein ABIV_2064 [Halarcobacter bivalviorum]RXK09157.1 hypothetical protein CRV05_11255 [Halarcobacter bivalviorum]
MTLNGLLEFLHQTSGLFVMLFVLLPIILYLEKKDNIRLNKNKDKYKNYLMSELENGHINSSNDLRRIYGTVLNKRYFFLEDWSNECLIEYSQQKEFDEIKYKILYDTIYNFSVEEPFSTLPEDERNLLEDIKEYKDKDNTIFNEKLIQLSKVVKLRYDKQNKTEKINKYLTYFSIIITTISIFKSI